MPRNWTPGWTADRAINVLARTLLKTVDDTKLMQESTHSVYSGEEQSNIEHMLPYGFTMVPKDAKDGKGAESVIGYVGTDRGNGVALSIIDRRYRLQNLKQGEVALHDDQTQQWHLARDGTYHSVPNDKKVTARIMRKDDKVKGKQQQGVAAAGGQNSDLGQQAWQPKTPYAHHSIDKDTRTVQHPGKIAHQVTDTDDQSTVIHESFVDQIKGILHSVQKGLHKISIGATTGIVSSVENALHSITISKSGGIVQTVQNALHSISLSPSGGINLKSSQSIQQLAPSINLTGLTGITGNLGVSGLSSFQGLASFAGGLGTGALEAAKDSDGGLVQATMGFKVVGGFTTDTQVFSSPLSNFINDAAAAGGGVAIGQLYRNGSVVMIRVS